MASDDGLMRGPAEFDLFGLAVAVELAGAEDASIAEGGPVLLGDVEEKLKASITAGCNGLGDGKGTNGDPEAFEFCGGGDAVVIKEEEAT
jgi:hypothetical protein